MGRDCTYCGAYVSDGLDACPACGRRLKAEKRGEAEPYTSSYSAAGAYAYQRAEENKEAVWEDSDRQTYRGGQSEPQSQQRASAEPEGDMHSSRQEYRERYERENADTDSRQAYQAQTEPGDPDDVRMNRGISFLCYFGPLFLIPYLTRPDSDFVKFHSNQGLLLMLLNAICDIIGLGFVSAVFSIVCLVMGLSAVSRGEKRKLPLIGGIRLLR